MPANRKKPCPEVFANQTYGGSSVWEDTLAAVKDAGYTFEAALACDDVDTPEDFKQLRKQQEGRSSHTADFLVRLQKEGVSLAE